MYTINYHCEGDYLIPDLVAPESPKIGIWGYRRGNICENIRIRSTPVCFSPVNSTLTSKKSTGRQTKCLTG